MTDQATVNREQYHHLWQEALHLMKGICDDDEMVALESLTPQVVSPASWVLIAPNKFALDNIEKSSLPVLQKTLRKLGVTKVELKLGTNPDLFAFSSAMLVVFAMVAVMAVVGALVGSAVIISAAAVIGTVACFVGVYSGANLLNR